MTRSPLLQVTRRIGWSPLKRGSASVCPGPGPGPCECLRSLSSASGSEAARRSPPIDHFRTLDLPRGYLVDPSELRSVYRSLMSQYHPDRHSLKSADEQERLTAASADVTTAYTVLSDPHGRAEHLLEIHGRPITEGDGDLVDSELLVEVMEIREEISAAEMDADVLRTLLSENSERTDATVEALGRAFQDEDFDGARRLTARLQYWRRIEEKVSEKLSLVKV